MRDWSSHKECARRGLRGWSDADAGVVSCWRSWYSQHSPRQRTSLHRRLAEQSRPGSLVGWHIRRSRLSSEKNGMKPAQKRTTRTCCVQANRNPGAPSRGDSPECHKGVSDKAVLRSGGGRKLTKNIVLRSKIAAILLGRLS